jgi:hypothetical protein
VEQLNLLGQSTVQVTAEHAEPAESLNLLRVRRVRRFMLKRALRT